MKLLAFFLMSFELIPQVIYKKGKNSFKKYIDSKNEG